MEIKVGWSAEVHGTWDKIDVVVEELDLQRLFAENDMEVPENLRTMHSFLLMEGMAENLITSYQARRHPQQFPVAEAKEAMLAIKKTQAQILDSYK